MFATSACSKLLPDDPIGPLPFSKKAYTATYERESFSGVMHQQTSFTMSADGKGLSRFEEADNKGLNTILISDYTTGKAYALYPSTRTGLWYGLRNTGGYLGNEEWLKSKSEATSLGEKEIDGHPCRGWKYSIVTSNTELWFGKDTGCLVYAENKDVPANKRGAWWKERLKTYSDKPMPPEAFSLTGYRVSGLP
jgi:hypothetical protein